MSQVGQAPVHEGTDPVSQMADPVSQIEAAILLLLRRANDPRGNERIKQLAGTDLERAGAVMLARVEELEPARLSELAAAAGVEMSTASRQVARMVEQGYVAREPDPTDARASRHRLTPAGRELRGRLKEAVRSWFELALSDFNEEERAALGGLLARLVEGMERSEGASDTSG